MCLGVPGKVTEVFEEDGIRMGTVDFGGIQRKACLEYAPEVGLGHYVVIHVDGSNISLEVIGADWGKNFAPYRSNGASLNDPRP